MYKDYVIVLPLVSSSIEKMKTIISDKHIYNTWLKRKLCNEKALAFCISEEKISNVLDVLNITIDQLKPTYYSIEKMRDIKLCGLTLNE